MMKINKLETWFSKLWFISTSRKCASHALLWFPSSMVDAKQTIRDTSIWGGGVKIKFGVGGQKKKQGIMFAGLLT
jgi:hypothetical protein